jgi:hypothetical protein
MEQAMDDNPHPDIAAVRRLLQVAFDAEGLRRFCLDRPALAHLVTYFGPNDSPQQKVNRVIER